MNQIVVIIGAAECPHCRQWIDGLEHDNDKFHTHVSVCPAPPKIRPKVSHLEMVKTSALFAWFRALPLADKRALNHCLRSYVGAEYQDMGATYR